MRRWVPVLRCIEAPRMHQGMQPEMTPNRQHPREVGSECILIICHYVITPVHASHAMLCTADNIVTQQRSDAESPSMRQEHTLL